MKQYNIEAIAVVLNINTGAQGCRPPSREDLRTAMMFSTDTYFVIYLPPLIKIVPQMNQTVRDMWHFQFIFKENPCSPAPGDNNLRRLLYFVSSWIP